MTHISEKLNELQYELSSQRDLEISALSEVLPQYVTDHNDKQAYRDIDRQVNSLARAFDRMTKLLDNAVKKAQSIENSVENFYGD